MQICLKFQKGGETLYSAEYDTEYQDITLADFARMAHEEFAKKRPDISLFQDDVLLKWDKVD